MMVKISRKQWDKFWKEFDKKDQSKKPGRRWIEILINTELKNLQKR